MLDHVDEWNQIDNANGGIPKWYFYFEKVERECVDYEILCRTFLWCELNGFMDVNYNEVGYHTWYGNIAHFLTHCLAKFETIDYIEFLENVIATRYINLDQKDYYDSTPYESYTKLTHTNTWDVGLFLIIYHPGQIVQIQACIRGMLVRKKLHKQRYKLCVNEILYACPKQFGYFFPGGYLYQVARSSFYSHLKKDLCSKHKECQIV